MRPEPVRFRVNGKEVGLDGSDEELLIYVLRNSLGLKATRFGCGLEQCGSCTVSVDSVARFSCTLPVAELEGKSVITAEALADDPVGAALLEAFEAEQAGQCGYCLAGIAMSAFLLLKESPRPSLAEIVERLDHHLCRCGAHPRILRAVERAAAALTGAKA